MALKWIKSNVKGLRYREHESKIIGVGRTKRPLRYFMMTYKWEGKSISESLGWEGEYVKNEDHARRIVQQLADNRKDRTPPFTLKGLREENQAKLVVQEEETRQEEIKSLTFAEIFSEYLIYSKVKKKNPRSWKREEQLFRLHLSPVIGNHPLPKIAEVPHLRNIQKNMEKAGSSPRTIRYALHVVRIVFHFAIDEGYFSGVNPALEKSKRAVSQKRSGVTYPQEDNQKERYLSREEADLLMKELAGRSGEVHNMAMLALYGGLRFGEIAKLTWGNVDIFQGTMKLRQTKNGKDRTAYMTPDIQKMFAQRGPGKPDHLVFPARGSDNKPHYMISHMYYSIVKKLFNQDVTDKKKWVNFHTLRHTFASWLVENGTDIYKVQELLGHGDLKMTERYAHNDRNQLKHAVINLQNG